MTTKLTGTALREAVATRVMGWKFHPECYPLQWTDALGRVCDPPDYESDIAHAWRVVEVMRAKGYTFQVGFSGHSEPAWWAGFADTERITEQGATTAPEAICLAAIAATEASK